MIKNNDFVHGHISIVEKTDRKFNLYTLINNKNELLNDVQFRKLEDCKRFINEILKGDERR